MTTSAATQHAQPRLVGGWQASGQRVTACKEGENQDYALVSGDLETFSTQPQIHVHKNSFPSRPVRSAAPLTVSSASLMYTSLPHLFTRLLSNHPPGHHNEQRHTWWVCLSVGLSVYILWSLVLTRAATAAGAGRNLDRRSRVFV